MLKVASFQEEKKLWKKGHSLVLGVDEAGRGCLAGPVYAAVAAWEKEKKLSFSVCDSKQLSIQKREESFQELKKTLFLWGVGAATHEEIDKWNILKATGLAVSRALEKVAKKIFSLFADNKVAYLIDGKISLIQSAYFFSTHHRFSKELSNTRKLLSNGFLDIPLIKGDQKSISIASASILAKVSRDKFMLCLDEKHPQYKFKEHKGYPTKKHRTLLSKHGPCTEHRFSFTPVQKLQ